MIHDIAMSLPILLLGVMFIVTYFKVWRKSSDKLKAENKITDDLIESLRDGNNKHDR